MPLALDRFRHSHSVQAPLEEHAYAPFRWNLVELEGRLVELSANNGGAVLTLAFALVWDAQQRVEPTAWVMEAGSSFYPPDAAANGIDLEALVVARVPDKQAISRAGERLARSGAFGLIVLDMGAEANIPPALQGRLMQQAQRHGTTILCVTEKSGKTPSLGSLISLRGQAQRQRKGSNHFVAKLTVTKDKRKGPGAMWREGSHGPPGLR